MALESQKNDFPIKREKKNRSGNTIKEETSFKARQPVFDKKPENKKEQRHKKTLESHVIQRGPPPRQFIQCYPKKSTIFWSRWFIKQEFSNSE